LLELNTNQYTLQRQYKITKDSLVILEGVFLFREEIAPFLDYSIFLHTDFSVALNRAKIRDKTQFGDQLTERYQNRYFPAQADYLSKHPLSKHADLIINNNCLDNPKILTVEEWQANFSKDFSS
jgi:uridine kinase